MLLSLDIRDILIIEALSLEFTPGLNVLTGETGAGKSILLDALGFVLGWRGRAELVRPGAKQGEVTAVFAIDPSHPVNALLGDAGLPIEDQLILRRINTVEGRKTAWINDRRCSGEVLRQVSSQILELHGQHDDRGLIDSKGHRVLLDRFGGLTDEAREVARQWALASQLHKRLQKAQEALVLLHEEQEYLRHALEEIALFDPQEGEENALDAQRRLMQQGARLREDIAKAMATMSGEGAEGALGAAMRWLDGVAAKLEGQLDPALHALERSIAELGEAIAQVENCYEALDFDPHELEKCEERLFALRALARKHQVAPDDLVAFSNGLSEKLAQIDQSDHDVKKLVQEHRAARQNYDDKAKALSQRRIEQASRLDHAVMDELAPLKMERAVFQTSLESGVPGAHGLDHVAFLVATNPGVPAGPLAKIASGGELSRFLLALKVALNEEASERVLIFDEIDRGVGGATADAVGRRLMRLAEFGQVLVVTHSPQVAALARHHFNVTKEQRAQNTITRVTILGADARVDEIARMLSGDQITKEARAAARALLSAANDARQLV